MKKFEYRILNIKSDTDNINKSQPAGVKVKTWLDLLNSLGLEGFETTGYSPTKGSLLLKRDITTS